MAKRIITISREFGSGGRTIGKKLAEQLGIAFYDKEIIEKVAEKTGFDMSYIEEHGEHAPSKGRFSYAFVGRTIDGQSPQDYLWSVQRDIILEIAEKEPCVIVGRCGGYILQHRDDCLNVFIHADEEKRARRIVKEYGETSENPHKRLRDKDKKRIRSYEYYTDRKWGAAANYTVTLDSGKIGLDKCVDIIADLAEKL